MIYSYIIIGLCFAFLAIVFAWMFMTSKVHYMMRIGVASVVVFMALVNWNLLTGILGYSVNDYPADKSIIISFIGMKEKKLEYLWIYTAEGPRTYALPYDEEFAKKLQKAQEEAKKRGGYMVYRRNGGTGNGSGDGKEGKQGQGGNGKGVGGKGVKTSFTDDSIPSNVEVIVPLPEKD